MPSIKHYIPAIKRSYAAVDNKNSKHGASQNLVFVDCSIHCLPLVSLGKSPIAVAIPRPVQLRNALLHALDKPIDRAHAVLGVIGATLERRQRDNAVIDDNPNLLS